MDQTHDYKKLSYQPSFNKYHHLKENKILSAGMLQ
jgi:hypothetical protein